MRGKIIDDCFRPAQALMRHADAIELLRSRIAPIAPSETVRLKAALGRILARPVAAAHPVPAHTNSAVDGYAFAYRDYDRDSGAAFEVSARAAAGHGLSVPPPPGTAVRIFTGAAMPPDLDTVAMQEDCTATGGAASRVRIPGGLKPGANVRGAGEDVAAGAELFAAGHVVRPQDLAALASIGLAEVDCFARLRLAIVSTGDELIRAGEADLASGQVYDANAPMLGGLAALAGCEAHDLGIWPDDADEVRARLAAAAETFDVILTSGGASRGEEDHMGAALAALGSRHFWQLAIKPGRPMMFGQIGRSIVAGLPGNPVAVFVCFLMYVWPLLRRLSGAPWPEPRRIPMRAAFELPGRKVGRREFWRGMLVETADGPAVDKFARDGSGLITGLRMADGLIDIPEEVDAVKRGDTVPFLPFTEFGILGR
ncbi:MAG: molybdopterin molybdotransferase MoeA [Hyphomicrobiaceae bacterium]|nr:molybdopterin molybdotransferase MoeA [Hyphomicrobiaceae bacterium]